MDGAEWLSGVVGFQVLLEFGEREAERRIKRGDKERLGRNGAWPCVRSQKRFFFWVYYMCYTSE